MEPFQTVTSSGDDPVVRMPAEQHDLWLWFHSGGIDAVFDAVREAAGALEGLAEVVSEQPSFTYQASRDLTGFEDGTENPPLDEAFSADRARLARMLDRMAGVGDEVTDRLTDFSHSTGGAWYVTPPVEAFAEA